jgi:hypothetical protein
VDIGRTIVGQERIATSDELLFGAPRHRACAGGVSPSPRPAFMTHFRTPPSSVTSVGTCMDLLQVLLSWNFCCYMIAEVVAAEESAIV